MNFRIPGNFRLAELAICLAVFLSCDSGTSRTEYSSHTAEFSAQIHAMFTASPGGGENGEYQAITEARIRLRRTDSAGGAIAMSLEVDSITYLSSERDPAELTFMRVRLKKYRADWRMEKNGHVTDLREEPELPRGDLTFRLGPDLAAILPIFSQNPADTQSLFDPSEPGAILIQGRLSQSSKSCELRMTGTEEGKMTGILNFTMDQKLGFPSALDLDVKGSLPESPDSGAIARPTEMRFRYKYRVMQTVP